MENYMYGQKSGSVDHKKVILSSDNERGALLTSSAQMRAGRIQRHAPEKSRRYPVHYMPLKNNTRAKNHLYV